MLPVDMYDWSCNAVVQCVKDCCNAILQELLSREEKVITGTAHTSDRRQYMSYILSAGPGEIYDKFIFLSKRLL